MFSYAAKHMQHDYFYSLTEIKFPIMTVFTSVVTLGCTVAGGNTLCVMSELCVTLLHYYVHSSMEIGLMTRPSHML